MAAAYPDNQVPGTSVSAGRQPIGPAAMGPSSHEVRPSWSISARFLFDSYSPRSDPLRFTFLGLIDEEVEVPRAPRMLEPGTTYHVVARGNNREPVYLDDHDRFRFVDLLGQAVVRHEWHHLAYCLMGNHFHLLVQTPRPDLPRGMARLLSVYARFFNARHRRSGHLFRERYKAVVVTNDRQLFTVLAYIARNPVRAGLTQAAAGWRWSSYPAVMGAADPRALLRVEEVLRFFDPDPARARDLFHDLVEMGRMPAACPGAAAYGFVPRPYMPSIATLAQVLPLDAAIEAASSLGYVQREIAEELGLPRSTVARRRLQEIARRRANRAVPGT